MGPAKAATNARKHGVTFEEATGAFEAPLARLEPDARHADRLVLVGLSRVGRLLFVVHAELDPDEAIRIISARRASKHERRQYEENVEQG